MDLEPDCQPRDAAAYLKARANRTFAQAFCAAVAESGSARAEFASEHHPASISLAELEPAVRRVAGGLVALGVEPGDVVAVLTPNWLETMVAHAATALAGAVLLPIVHIYGPGELSFILRHSGAKVLITPRKWQGRDYIDWLSGLRADLPHLHQVVVCGPVRDDAPDRVSSFERLMAAAPLAHDVQVSPDDVAMLIFTSGTTSDPKGVQHSHRTLLAELHSAPDNQAEAYALSPWPPGHVAGMMALARFWMLGRPGVFMERWDAAEAVRLIARHAIVSTAGTPFHLTSLLDAAEARGADISCLTDYLVGATTVPPSLIARCNARGLATYRAYGLSEHPTISRGSREDPAEKRVGTDGRLCPGVEVMIVDDDGTALSAGCEGEILARGPERFLGYRDQRMNDGVLLADGWLRTGDIGRLDAEGFLTITDRKKDIIIRGGENIASREIEDLLLGVRGVREAAAVGAPDARLGEVVCAFLVLEPGASMDIAEIAAQFAAKGIARQKVPEKLVLTDALPRNAAGKVLKPVLRDQLKARTA